MSKKKPTASSRLPTARQIEKIDRQLVELANERARLTLQRLAAKPEEDDPLAVVTQDIDPAVKANSGPLPNPTVRAMLRELGSGIQAVHKRVRVAYLGPEYTFSHLAAIERFGQAADYVPVTSIAAVFETVEQGNAEFGMVPMENSTDGRVTDALDGFSKSNVRICGEVPLKIRHCLLGIGKRADVQRICSKPQALSQCRNWLAKQMPKARIDSVASTAEAARLAAKDSKVAAVASEQSGAIHGLKVLARDIQDNPDNVTRFAVIGDTETKKTGRDKTSLMFEAPHEPGALADVMNVFKRQNLNLTWIESYPIPGAQGRYLFFLEFQGHRDELRPRRALAAIEKKSLRLTVLGSYAQADPIG